MLLDHSGKVVTREEIKKKLWPNDTIVEFDQSIHSAIRRLRQALGDSAEKPKYIETVGQRGYRLLVSVQSLDSGSGETAAVDGGTAAAMPLQSAGLVGRQVSHYRVLDVLGGGGMGMVYRAEDLKLGRQVALKFLPEDMADDPVALQRFEREARTASSLNHPNICYIQEFGEHEGQPFIAMELLEGATLRDRLAELAAVRRAMPIDELVKIAAQVAEGLEAAHEKGIIHRDIKPANIFLTRQGTAKILDFGLAKLAQVAPEEEQMALGASVTPGGEGREPLTEYSLTRAGAAMGTAGYMSPEQVRGEKLDSRTDLFSFGLVLYEMACGQRAFSGQTAAILKTSILHDDPVPVRELNSAIPIRLEEIIGKLTEKRREKRYQVVAEARAALVAVLADSQPSKVRLSGGRQWKMWAGAAAAVFVMAGLGTFWWRSHKAPGKLAARDTIVLADFANSTGDSIFDGTLRQALDLNLQQSPWLNVLSERKVSEALKAIHRNSAEVLTPGLAQQVCTETHSRAVLSGSIVNRGNSYVIGLRAADCKTGDVLADVSSEAGNRDAVIHALGEAGTRLRTSVGDPTASQSEFNQPLEKATTASLDALQEYVLGRDSSRLDEPIPHLNRAVQLDPNFALAYQLLGRHYQGSSQPASARQSFSRAYELRDRLSQRHRLLVDASYSVGVTKDFEKAVQTFQELLQRFPESGARNQLCYVLRLLGRLEQAAAVCREAIRFNRTELSPFINGTLSYMSANRPLEAQALLDEASAQGFTGDIFVETGYDLAFVRGDEARMQDYFNRAMGKPGLEDELLSRQADTETYFGHVTNAQGLWQRAVESAMRAGTPDVAAQWRTAQAIRDAEVGFPVRSRKLAAEALALKDSHAVKSAVALVLARSGDLSQAAKIADEVNQEFPLDTLIQSYELPAVRASIELQRKHPAKAIEILEATKPYELANTFLFPNVLPPYLRGEAYLQAGQGQRAVEEFKKVLAYPGIVGNCVTGALAHLQLARAHAMAGDKTAARRSYQDFLALWKDADPDIPIFRQAKAEYAKLP